MAKTIFNIFPFNVMGTYCNIVKGYVMIIKRNIKIHEYIYDT